MISERMRLKLSGSSAIRAAFEHAQALRCAYGENEVFDFSIGNPSASCPEGVKDALVETLQEPTAAHGYMNSAGYQDVREAVADSLKRCYSVEYSPEDIIMTTGAACAINIALQTLVDPGDEIIVFRPYYPAYEAFAANWDARVVQIPYGGGFLPDFDSLGKSFTERTKIVLVNTPNNPSGAVYPHEVAQRIVAELEQAQDHFGHDIYLLSDEPYRELVWDGLENPCWPSLYENTLVAYSFSKSASLAGERIGYLALSPNLHDKELLREGLCRSLGDLGFVNAPATSQRMAKHCVDDFADLGEYERNRDLLYGALCDFGFSPHKPQGAFYLLLPVPDAFGTPYDAMDASTFESHCADCERELLERLQHELIVAVAGSEFGAPGYVRLSFCLPPDAIRRSLPRFASVARSYGLAPSSSAAASKDCDTSGQCTPSQTASKELLS